MPSRLDLTSSDRVSPARQGAHVAEMQRRRLLNAVFALSGGAGGVREITVARLCQRAGVSRRTFYALFTDLETCMVAAFEEAIALATQAIVAECPENTSWRVRMRNALTALLRQLDDRPELARLLIVEALSAGPRVLERRALVVRDLTAVVDEGRAVCRSDKAPPPLTAEGVVGAVFAVVHARLLASDSSMRQPLCELTSQLMGLIVHPYLGASAAEAELEIAVPGRVPGNDDPRTPATPFADMTMRLTYRTALVLSSIAAAPGSSNKQVASAAGVSDEGQMSRLLTRLERNGLVCNSGGEPARGEAKAWKLTPRGTGILQAVGQV